MDEKRLGCHTPLLVWRHHHRRTDMNLQSIILSIPSEQLKAMAEAGPRVEILLRPWGEGTTSVDVRPVTIGVMTWHPVPEAEVTWTP